MLGLPVSEKVFGDTGGEHGGVVGDGQDGGAGVDGVLVPVSK